MYVGRAHSQWARHIYNSQCTVSASSVSLCCVASVLVSVTVLRHRAHGKGVYRTEGGNVYEGEFKHDKCEGFGVYQFNNGDKYEGMWKHGRKTGQCNNIVAHWPRCVCVCVFVCVLVCV